MAQTKSLYQDDSYLRTAKARVIGCVPEGLVLDQTVFYPMAGGQPGDTGTLYTPGGTLRIADTRKDKDTGAVLHVLENPSQLEIFPREGEEVELTLDWDRRLRHMRMHTALHLLCSLIPGGVTGGQIGSEKSRLDFAAEEGLPDKQDIEDAINAHVAANDPVNVIWENADLLKQKPELVRTLSVMPPVDANGALRLIRIGPEESVVDFQPCGGTHVSRTGEIGRLRVGKIENKGRNNKRIALHLCD